MYYICGPITNAERAIEVENCHRAMNIALEMIRRGYSVYCPHWTGLVAGCHEISHERWMEHDHQWLRLCDSILLLPGWRQSTGARMEFQWAGIHGLKFYEWVDGEPVPYDPRMQHQEVPAEVGAL